MFGLFESQEKKMRRNAANWLDLADRVWALRRDVLSPADAAELTGRREELRQGMRHRADAGKLKLGIEALEGALRRAGGAVYPKTSLVENVEFFLVAAIVILGIRTYFVQPFKIPTNSMWPSYFGMTGQNYPPGTPAPGPVAVALRFALFGAVRHQAVAPRAGAVSALFFNKDLLAYTKRRGHTWLVFPTDVKEYTFFVDGEPATVRVPFDFSAGARENAGSFDDMVIQTYFGGRAAFEAAWDRLARAGQLMPEEAVYDDTVHPNSVTHAYRMPLGRTVQRDEPLIRFDVLTGDQLFVDRVSYHFFPPKIGQGFVFRTDHIPRIGKADYYIKRLVGLPGDTIQVRPPILYRNGAPIEGARAFELNARREGNYTGYTQPPPPPEGFFPVGGSVTVPERGFFAMGDNSSNSADGRYWGFVPADDVIGRPLFIYYPFSKRWGPAR